MFDKVGNPFSCAFTEPETFQTATGCRAALQFEQHFPLNKIVDHVSSVPSGSAGTI